MLRRMRCAPTHQPSPCTAPVLGWICRKPSVPSSHSTIARTAKALAVGWSIDSTRSVRGYSAALMAMAGQFGSPAATEEGATRKDG